MLGGKTIRIHGIATVGLVLLAVPACAQQEPVVGGPCEGCEAVFVGLPDPLTSSSRIAPEAEPGTPMTIQGTVRDRNGDPEPGIIVYASHTDDDGVYPAIDSLAGSWAGRHGQLRAWARTDTEGRYRFETIRPGIYPSRNEPAHVHMHIIEPGRCTYYLTSIHFTDDPLLDSGEPGEPRGGPGLVTPRRTADGGWTVTRDITLGMNVPGYDRCGDISPSPSRSGS